MSIKDYESLSDMQMDALREMGNIGSGNAATSLSQMLSQKVDIAVPRIKILDYNTVVENLGGPEKILIGILISLEGDVTGMIMFLLHKEFAHMVVSELTGCEMNDQGEVDDFDQSAIQEVGNIMAASYINAMAELTGLEINISVPSLSIDMTGAILSVPAIYYANISDKIIFIEDEIDKDNDKNRNTSQILLILDVESLDKIMGSLGI